MHCIRWLHHFFEDFARFPAAPPEDPFEARWGMKDRCVTHYGASKLRDYSDEGRYLTVALDQAGLIHVRGFTCMTPKGYIVQGYTSSYDSNASSTIELFYTTVMVRDAMEKALMLQNRIAEQNRRLNG